MVSPARCTQKWLRLLLDNLIDPLVSWELYRNSLSETPPDPAQSKVVLELVGTMPLDALQLAPLIGPTVTTNRICRNGRTIRIMCPTCRPPASAVAGPRGARARL